MRKVSVQYFTRKEEECVELFVQIGMRRTVAKVLVFLGCTPEATSRDIERGSDMRESDVSLALKELAERGWLESSGRVSQKGTGRPIAIHKLALPFGEILKTIEKEKREDLKKKIALFAKIRDNLKG